MKEVSARMLLSFCFIFCDIFPGANYFMLFKGQVHDGDAAFYIGPAREIGPGSRHKIECTQDFRQSSVHNHNTKSSI